MPEYINKIRTSSGDLPVNYEALANLPTISNPNLLINSDFRNPINQRDQVKYEGMATKGYTIDRWCMGEQDFNRTVEIVNGGIKITNPNTEYPGTFQQIFEKVLPSGDYTLSIKVISKSGGATMSCGGSHGSTKKELSIGINTLTLTSATVSSFIVQLSPNSSIALEWAKLEAGTVATLFVPRIYGEEFALCQRYFCIIGGTRAIGLEQDKSAKTITYVIPRYCVMRGTPNVILKGTTTTNSTDGICVRTIGCAIIPGMTFTYSIRNWELQIIAKYSGTLNEDCYQTQLFINDAFKICLDAEIY